MIVFVGTVEEADLAVELDFEPLLLAGRAGVMAFQAGRYGLGQGDWLATEYLRPRFDAGQAEQVKNQAMQAMAFTRDTVQELIAMLGIVGGAIQAEPAASAPSEPRSGEFKVTESAPPAAGGATSS